MDGIRDPEAKRRYKGSLRMFLEEIPDSIYHEILGEKPDSTIQSKAEFFVNFCKKSSKMGHNIIAEYIKMKNTLVESGEISANTIPNYIKSIKVLLDQNGVALIWNSLYKKFPRETKSDDRAYTRKEIQQMMENAASILDKVIITMFS